jgi:hypothetical protein
LLTAPQWLLRRGPRVLPVVLVLHLLPLSWICVGGHVFNHCAGFALAAPQLHLRRWPRVQQVVLVLHLLPLSCFCVGGHVFNHCAGFALPAPQLTVIEVDAGASFWCVGRFGCGLHGCLPYAPSRLGIRTAGSHCCCIKVFLHHVRALFAVLTLSETSDFNKKGKFLNVRQRKNLR